MQEMMEKKAKDGKTILRIARWQHDSTSSPELTQFYFPRVKWAANLNHCDWSMANVIGVELVLGVDHTGLAPKSCRIDHIIPFIVSWAPVQCNQITRATHALVQSGVGAELGTFS